MVKHCLLKNTIWNLTTTTIIDGKSLKEKKKVLLLNTNYSFSFHMGEGTELFAYELTYLILPTSLPKSSYVDSGLQFVQRDPAAVAQHLPADVLTYGGGP